MPIRLTVFWRSAFSCPNLGVFERISPSGLEVASVKNRPHIAAACIALSLAGLQSPASAEETTGLQATGAVSPMCLVKASVRQKLPISVLLALMKTEGGYSGLESPNRDGSYDLGVMQVNDKAWLRRISTMHFGGDMRAARQEIRDNGCYNVNIGAWIFRQALDEAHGDTVLAVGYYNSHTPLYMHQYQSRVAQNFARVLATFGRYNLMHQPRPADQSSRAVTAGGAAVQTAFRG